MRHAEVCGGQLTAVGVSAGMVVAGAGARSKLHWRTDAVSHQLFCHCAASRNSFPETSLTGTFAKWTLPPGTSMLPVNVCRMAIARPVCVALLLKTRSLATSGPSTGRRYAHASRPPLLEAIDRLPWGWWKTGGGDNYSKRNMFRINRLIGAPRTPARALRPLRAACGPSRPRPEWGSTLSNESAKVGCACQVGCKLLGVHGPNQS
jgi:hypothetical protein